MQKIHQRNPYEGFEHHAYPFDSKGGMLHPLFQRVIDGLKPGLIIEVGAWKGASALHMAGLLKNANLDAAVICVDT